MAAICRGTCTLTVGASLPPCFVTVCNKPPKKRALTQNPMLTSQGSCTKISVLFSSILFSSQNRVQNQLKLVIASAARSAFTMNGKGGYFIEPVPCFVTRCYMFPRLIIALVYQQRDVFWVSQIVDKRWFSETLAAKVSVLFQSCCIDSGRGD